MRHAKALAGDSGDDHGRALHASGWSDARSQGLWMAESGLLPQAAVCSDARRTRETLDGVWEGAGQTWSARYDQRLYMANVGAFVEVLRDAPDVERLLLVSHNPGCEQLVAWLTGELIAFETSMVARIRVDAAWDSMPRGKLLGVVLVAREDAARR